MAVELKLEDYCQNCCEFEAEVDKQCYYSNEKVFTNITIRCEHADLCKRITEHMKSHKEEKQ